MDDVDGALSMAWDYGAVKVFEDTMLPTTGWTIGGNESTGGSNLHAAVEEARTLEGQPPRVLYEIENCCIVVRWCDDGVQIWDKKISAETKHVLWTMRQRLFYGAPLMLENLGAKQDEAFGFVWLTGGGTVRLSPVMQFLK